MAASSTRSACCTCGLWAKGWPLPLVAPAAAAAALAVAEAASWLTVAPARCGPAMLLTMAGRYCSSSGAARGGHSA